MTSANLELLIGRLGTRQGGHLGEVLGPLVGLGTEAFPMLLRVLQEEAFRVELWQRHGEQHVGEPILEFPGRAVSPHFEIPLLDARVYNRLLVANSLSVMSHRRESKEEPWRSAIEAVVGSMKVTPAMPETSVTGKRGDGKGGKGKVSERRAWLDACRTFDLQAVKNHWLGREADEEEASAGLLFALVWGGRGIAAEQAAVLEFLLSRGGNIDTEITANIGTSALHHAAADDDPERVEWLLEHGAGVNHEDWDDRTALMHALQGDGRVGPRNVDNRRRVLELLFQHGALMEMPALQEVEEESGGATDFGPPTIWDFADEEGEELLKGFKVFRP